MHFRLTRPSRLACRWGVFATLGLQACVLPSLIAETANLQGTPVEVLSRSIVTLPNGSVTFIRIRPPVLPPKPIPPPPPPETPLSPEDQAALEREELKIYDTLSVTATVYTHADGTVAVTELTWRDEERSFRAWSTADFRLLRQLRDISLETHRFQWFPFIDSMPLAEVPTGQQPFGLQLFPSAPEPDALPEYCFEGTEAEAASVAPALAALDWLHAHYYLNKAELALDLARREAEGAAQAIKAAEDAKRPRHQQIYFWKIQ